MWPRVVRSTERYQLLSATARLENHYMIYRPAREGSAVRALRVRPGADSKLAFMYRWRCRKLGLLHLISLWPVWFGRHAAVCGQKLHKSKPMCSQPELGCNSLRNDCIGGWRRRRSLFFRHICLVIPMAKIDQVMMHYVTRTFVRSPISVVQHNSISNCRFVCFCIQSCSKTMQC